MDMCLRYGQVTLAMELKVQRDSPSETLREHGPNQLEAGLAQIEGYIERLKLATGWLVIFDYRQAALPIAERVRTELHSTAKSLPITVICGVAPGHPGALSFSQNQLNLSMADKGEGGSYSPFAFASILATGAK